MKHKGAKPYPISVQPAFWKLDNPKIWCVRVNVRVNSVVFLGDWDIKHLPWAFCGRCVSFEYAGMDTQYKVTYEFPFVGKFFAKRFYNKMYKRCCH